MLLKVEDIWKDSDVAFVVLWGWCVALFSLANSTKTHTLLKKVGTEANKTLTKGLTEELM